MQAAGEMTHEVKERNQLSFIPSSQEGTVGEGKKQRTRKWIRKQIHIDGRKKGIIFHMNIVVVPLFSVPNKSCQDP